MDKPLEENGIDKKSTTAFFVVGIGASAGGLEALEKFFNHLPSDSGLAYVVIQHLSPTHKSHMVELLSRQTKLPVQHAQNDTVVEPNTVYLIPPKKVMSINDRTLRLVDRQTGPLPSYPIDHFFESLAEDLKDKAIGIVLSGTGSDGSRGLRAIKEAGGVALAQEPDSAQFDGMPRSAISTMIVDDISTPDELPDIVIKYASNPLFKRKPQEKEEPIQTDSFSRILQILLHYSGVDFKLYKPNTIRRRIEHRMGLRQIYNEKQYMRYLEKSEEEVKRLYRELLIGVTRFFRDKYVFEQVEKLVIPALFDNAIEKGYSTIRCWIPGCSTGEEAYSLAMLLHEEQRRREQHIEVKIFATDIDPDAIVTASSGVFSGSVVADLSPERLSQYFIRKDEYYQIARELRQMIIFAPHNILKDIPFSKVDLISCRNLMIYFGTPTQQKVLSNFTYALKPGGHLLLGTSEHITGKENLFTIIDNKAKIFRNKSTSPSLLSSDLVVRDKTTWSTKLGGDITSARSSASVLSDHINEALATHMPPSVVINLNYNVLYFFGDTSHFLRLPVGLANLNILKIVPQKVRTILGTALHKAFKQGIKVVYPGLSITNPDKTTTSFDLVVEPLKVSSETETVLVVFRPLYTGSVNTEATVEYDIEEETKTRILDLEKQLEYTEESLQAAIEELETSNEELQATNEELIASNEELQSTNEELQSTNEELSTVNSELQKKVQELTEINTDMDYLLDSTDLSTIFLDAELCVRKFTPPATSHFYLQSSDIGRPIYHFTHSFGDIDFRSISQQVLATGTTQEIELNDNTGNTYVLRATPYKTSEISARGVVLMFLDISNMNADSPENIHKYLESQSREFLQQQKKQENLIFLAAHDLKAPLRFIRQSVENLSVQASSDDDRNEHAIDSTDLLRQIGGMNDTIDDLIMYSRPNSNYAPDVPIELSSLLDGIRNKMSEINDLMIILEDEPPPFKTSKPELEMVLGNLISQSIAPEKEANTITVSAKIKDNITTFNIINTSLSKAERKADVHLRFPLTNPGPDIKFEVAKKAIENRGGSLITGKRGSSYTIKWPIIRQPVDGE